MTKVARRFDVLSPPVLFGGIYVLLFGLTVIDAAIVDDPTIYRLRNVFVDFRGISRSALVYVWVGFALFILGYYLPIGKALASLVPGRRSSISAGRASLATVALFSATFLVLLWYAQRFGLGRGAAFAEDQPTTDVLFLQVIGEMSLLYYALGVWRFMLARCPGAPRMSRGDALFVWLVMFPLQVAVSVFGGGRFRLLIVILIILLAYHYGYSRLRARSILVGGLVFVALAAPGVAYLRELDLGGSPLEKDSYLVWIWHSVMVRNSSLEGFTVAFENLDSAPQPGEPLWLLFASALPRLFWSDKPISSWQEEFSTWSGGTPGAGFLPSLPGELLLRFGHIGGLIGMLVLGILWRTAFGIFIGSKDRAFEWGFIYLVLFALGLSTVETGFVIPYGALFRLVMVGLLTFILVRAPGTRAVRVPSIQGQVAG